MSRYVREESVKVLELGKRSVCYHSLRKAYAPGGVHKRRREAVQAMQEQQEPVPIHIRIDTQEQRSGIPDLLAGMPQVHVEAIPLCMGDYDVGGDPCRIFERKNGSDVASTLVRAR